MSYVRSNLMPGENIVAVAKIHWWIFVTPGILTLIGLLLARHRDIGGLGVILLLVGLILLVKAIIYRISTELAVTSKRVIAKFGFIRRTTIELSHRKMESLNVNQGILGRILNFGTVVVTGSGGTATPIPSIDAPLEFRRAALSAIETTGNS
jgi:uncharacterized membrane protein YdbT with pleckstrin-like domain